MGAPKRTPPRRESIEDHLKTAARVIPGVDWSRSSREFVRDLYRRKLIDEPVRIKKRGVVGQGARLRPPAYRDLLEILRLRAAGHLHRERWLVWLWSRGRSFPLADVRSALERELDRAITDVRRQIYPTGRSTEPFLKKYERNIAPTLDADFVNGLGGLAPYLFAQMARPQEAAEIPLDFGMIADTVATMTGADASEIRTRISRLANGPAESAESGLLGLIDAFPDASDRGLMDAAFQAMKIFGFPSTAGYIDDGRGGSILQTTLCRATDEKIVEIRTLVRALRTGTYERLLRQHAMAIANDEERAVILRIVDWAQAQRNILRGGPAFAAFLICVYLRGDEPTAELPEPSRLDVSALLKAQRN